jgi:hypothetical protein
VSTFAAGRFIIKKKKTSTVRTSLNSYEKAPESPARAEYFTKVTA